MLCYSSRILHHNQFSRIWCLHLQLYKTPRLHHQTNPAKHSAGHSNLSASYLKFGHFFLTIRILDMCKKHAGKKQSSMKLFLRFYCSQQWERICEYFHFPAAQSITQLHILYDFNEGGRDQKFPFEKNKDFLLLLTNQCYIWTYILLPYKNFQDHYSDSQDDYFHYHFSKYHWVL